MSHLFPTPLRALALGLALSAASLPASADPVSDAKLDELQQKLDQSLKMIEALSNRVKELETHPAATVAAASAAPAAAPAATAGAPAVTAGAAPSPEAQRLDAMEQKVEQIETANATRQTDDTGLPMHGFADVGLGNHNPYFAESKGAYIGSFDFYLNPKLGDKVVSLAELIFETGPDGEVGTDLERFQIGYQFNDEATVWVGRFHTPYGYVNTALHHGVWLADSLRRPKFANFEDHGGVMPSHTVGVWLTGAKREFDGKVLYDFYAGNGQQIQGVTFNSDGTVAQGGIVDMQSGGTEHGAAMAGSRLSYQFTGGAVDGLTVGVNGFTDKVNSDNPVTTSLTRLNMLGAYAVYDTDMWEHIIEAYSFHDTNINGPGGTNKSTAWFAQFAYRAPWGVPYVRYERADLDQRDLYFAEQQFGASYYRGAAGVRFDVNLKSAVKFEVAHTRTLDIRMQDLSYGLPVEYNEVLAQYAYRF